MLAGDNESYICAGRTAGEVLQKLSIFSSRMSTKKNVNLLNLFYW